MGEFTSLVQPHCAEVPQIVLELIRRAELYAAGGLVGEANSAFYAAIVADDSPYARLAYAAHLVSHGQWASAELQLRLALDLAHARASNDERCACCLALATASGLQHKDADEASWLQQAVKWQLADQGILSADVLIHLASHAIRHGRLEQARQYLNSAESISGDENLPLIQLHLSILDRLQGAEQNALSRLTEAHRGFRSEGDIEGCAFALINSGHLLCEIDRSREAMHCFDQARRIFETLGQTDRARQMRGFCREAAHAGSLRADACHSN